MTIRTPDDNLLDKILMLFGKERDIIFPEGADEIYRKYGPHVQIKAKKESFFKVLFGKPKKQNKEN